MYPKAKVEDENSPAAIGRLIEGVIEEVEQILPVEKLVEIVRT